MSDGVQTVDMGKLKGKVVVDYVFQDLNAFTDGYQVPADQRIFGNAKIYVQGYRGNLNWVAIADATQSPAIVLLEQTGETVRFAIASRSKRST